jgi:acyl-CoA synthetase (AMP-forming)/AMP-acid ligase II
MATEHGDEPAYTRLASELGPASTFTFAEWEAGSNRLARGLVAAGVQPGDRLLLHLEDHHLQRWFTAYSAIHTAGAVAVPTNVRLTATELAGIVDDAEPTWALTSARLAPLVAEAAGAAHRTPTIVAVDDDAAWGALLADDPSTFGVTRGDDDLADILYTSGTTGRPKGVAVRHRNTHIVANSTPRWTGKAWIHCSPLSTFAGISFVYNPMKMGMRGLHLPRFDVGRWLDAIAAERPASAFLVPAMVQLLLADERTAAADLSSLTVVSIGSAPLAPTLHQAVADLMPGALVTNNYSMTEAGTAFTYLPPGELSRRPGSVGIPLPPTEIRIADPDGEPVATGEVGEVLIGVGDQHREYYRDPDATARTWSGPWLRSGDLGRLDEDGYLYIVGRAKDVVIRGGHNISATEVEHALHAHAGVLEAAVVGIPHDVLGEDVAAFVVARPGRQLDADELRRSCAARLADYKVPRTIWFVDALPRNATGKVVKSQLSPPTTGSAAGPADASGNGSGNGTCAAPAPAGRPQQHQRRCDDDTSAQGTSAQQ